nr:hypothetical protein [Tanacetum cinerariifolium]
MYGAMLPIELTNDEIRNTKAYKEYYAFTTGEAAPKPNASAKRKRSGSNTSITPPTATTTPTTTVAVTPNLTAATNGKQPSKAKSPSDPTEVARTEAQQLKIVLKRSTQQTHISQPGGSGTDEGTGSKPGVPDVLTDESKEELSWNSSDDEGADDQEKVGDDDKGDEVAADLSEMKLKKILIEKMKGNKFIQLSDEQRNLYKALFDAYEADKTILDSYGETVILKRRRDDDDDQDEGASAGSDQGSKRRREGKEPESASAPLETATRSACWSTTGSKSQQVSARESPFAEEPVQTTSQLDEPSYPVFETDRDWNKTLPAVQGSTQTWISELAKQADSHSSFNELLDWSWVPPLLINYWLLQKEEKASKKERKAYDRYNRCSKKLSRVVSPMRLECIAGH